MCGLISLLVYALDCAAAVACLPVALFSLNVCECVGSQHVANFLRIYSRISSPVAGNRQLVLYIFLHATRFGCRKFEAFSVNFTPKALSRHLSCPQARLSAPSLTCRRLGYFALGCVCVRDLITWYLADLLHISRRFEGKSHLRQLYVILANCGTPWKICVWVAFLFIYF